jgi:cell division protein FtsI (penicillin-binding protein 3)
MRVLKAEEKVGVELNGLLLRKYLLLGIMLLGMIVLVGRAIYLQGIDTEFLQAQGDKRHVDEIPISAFRGKVLDRNNEPLAISTPVTSVWVNPQHFKKDEDEKVRQVAKILQVSDKKINNLLSDSSTKTYVYLKRHISPKLKAEIKALQVSGVYFEREVKRYYPAGAVSAHVIGFTDIDGKGQEGLERGYQESLKGTDGKKRVLRDGRRRVIQDIENISAPIKGQDLVLSIDQRIQYVAFKSLEAGVREHKASSGSLIVLDAKNGEVLAAVSQPAFNPNSRRNLKGSAYRHRAFLDVFEPGSTVKPFVIAGALDGKYINEDIEIETHGFYKVARNLVKDTHDYGTLNLTNVLKKSSNIAAVKIAQAMPYEYFWKIYHGIDFGISANVGFPGEVSGTLSDYQGWHLFEHATLAYGYGVSTSTLQLAKAYTALADDGILHSVSLLKREEDDNPKRVFTAETAKKVRAMLEHVVLEDGTAFQARVDGYRVAGKTGTAKKAKAGGYAEKKYQAVFVGMAPASDPKFVIAVMVDEPSAGKYYGGQVAAPIFSKVMAGALRLYGVPPDKEESMPVLLTRALD